MFSWFKSSRYEGGTILQFYIVILVILTFGCKETPEPEPIISQQADLDNFVNINYIATLMNTKEATRRILWNGDPFETKIITIPSYSETFQNMTKGDYTFKLEAEGASPNIVDLTIPNYDPEADQQKLYSLETDLDKNSSKTLNLEGIFYDKNKEDNPVPIQSATSLDGKVDVSLDGYNLTMNTNSLAWGAYQIELEVGSSEGGLAKIVLDGNILGEIYTLAFSESVGGGLHIFKGDFDIDKEILGNVQQLTTGNSQNHYLSWSPDGKEIAYISTSTGKWAGWIMKEDGTNKRDISSKHVDRVLGIDLDMNGRAIVSYLDPVLGRGLGIIDLANDTFSSIYSGVEPAAHPRFSSDGNEIVFFDYVGSKEDILKIGLDGKGLINITNTPDIREFFSTFTPDDLNIFFSSDKNGSGLERDIYKTNKEGTTYERVTSAPGAEHFSSISSDGKYLTYTGIPNVGPTQIYLLNLLSGEIFQITNSSGSSLQSDFKPN